MGRLVRLQAKYAKKRHERKQRFECVIDPLSDSIITRLEYLGRTRDLLPGGHTLSDTEHYEVRKLDDSNEYALISGDAVYGISSAVMESSYKGFQPLRLPIINVNDGFGKLKTDLQNNKDSFGSLTMPLLRTDHSFSSFKKYLQNVLKRNDHESFTLDGIQKANSLLDSKSNDEGGTMSSRNDDTIYSPKGTFITANYGYQQNSSTAGINDVTGSLRVYAIKPPSYLPSLTNPTKSETDMTSFGQVWPHSLRTNMLAHPSHLMPMCSEPPPTTPESNLSDSELDKSQEVMTVTLRHQLFKNSETSTPQRTSYRSKTDTYYSELNGSKSQHDFSDLRLDVIRRPLREKYQVK